MNKKLLLTAIFAVTSSAFADCSWCNSCRDYITTQGVGNHNLHQRRPSENGCCGAVAEANYGEGCSKGVGGSVICRRDCYNSCGCA